MKRATLNYIIRDLENVIRVLPLETSSLYNIDKYTSPYHNETDFLNNFSKKEKVNEFNKSFGINNGCIRISYAKNIYDKDNLMPLYNSNEEIFMSDNFINNKITEVEKARKLLFNSQGQLFIKMLLSSKSFSDTYDYRLSISYHEYLIAKKYGLFVEQEDDSYYINFTELFRYRFFNKKLGALRELYEDMLEIWKDKIMQLDDDDFYYYSRQLRILIKKYERAKVNQILINNLQIWKKNDCYISYFLKQKYNNYRLVNKLNNRKKKVKNVS